MYVTGRNGVVTASSRDAVAAGLRILAAGGNAADAATAAVLAASVTQIGSVCLGGEAAVLVFRADTGRVQVVAAQGAAPRDSKAIDQLYRRGIPTSGIEAAATPALLDACVAMLREFGSMSFEEVATPALELLDGGRPPTYLDSSLKKRLDALTGTVVPQGTESRAPRAWSADLARTLRTLIGEERRGPGPRATRLDHCAESYRHGEIASALARWYHDLGAFLGRADLAAHVTALEEPLTYEYRGHTVCKADTWTQGLFLLQALGLLEGLDLERGTIAERCHAVSESIKLALADRDLHFGDPRFTDVPTKGLLSREYLALRRALIDPATAKDHVAGDPVRMRAQVEQRFRFWWNERATISCLTTDRWGNVVVMTPSGIGSTAGSGGTTGLTHGTRLRSACTQRGHANALAPGKRPSVTLSPTLVLRAGRPFLAMSVPGGHLQDQVALHVILAIVDRGRRVEELVERDADVTPVLVDPTGRGSILRVQWAVWPAIGDALSTLGHRVEPTQLSFHRLGGSLLAFNPADGTVEAWGIHAGAC